MTAPARTSSSLLLLVVFALGCKPEEKAALADAAQARKAPPKIIGVHPDSFDCEKFLSANDVASVAHGKVTFVASSLTPAPGTPRPCNYVQFEEKTEEQRKKEAEEEERRQRNLPAPGKETMEDVIATYPEDKSKVFGFAIDCRKTAKDRATRWIESLRTGGMVEVKDVAVGEKAIDHTGGQLAFYDDKTPCVVTVSAPDEAGRLALARLVHAKLRPENAPMTPRSVPQ